MPRISGSKWGASQAPGSSGGVVTWSLADGGLRGAREAFRLDFFGGRSDRSVSGDSLLPYSPVAVLKQAFESWSRHANIQFVQVKDDGARIGESWGADIRIGFVRIDGAGGVLGLGFLPGGSSRAGDILFDAADARFFAGRNKFLAVAAHEIGHAIGLEHVTGERALMNETFTGATAPLRDDIIGVKAIYGGGGREGGFLQLGGGPSDLDVRQTVRDLTISGTHAENEIRGGGAAELIMGKAGDDDLIGRGGGDTLHGGSGDDRLQGDGGRDALAGQAGADMLLGGPGGDRLFGGGGGDLLRGDDGRDYLNGGEGRDTLIGGDGADRLVGEAEDDVMVGGGGRDEFFGCHGDDRMHGDDDGDHMHGGLGDDRLFGGAGDDRLTGGVGDDVLSGGGGRDVFVFRGSVFGADVITDFQNGVDLIDLSGSAAAGSFDDLAIIRRGSDAVITLSDEAVITLSGLSPAALDASDFLF